MEVSEALGVLAAELALRGGADRHLQALLDRILDDDMGVSEESGSDEDGRAWEEAYRRGRS